MMLAVVAFVAVLLGVVETVAYYRAPQLLARVAFLPLGFSRELVLTQEQREMLTRPLPAFDGYRALARCDVELLSQPAESVRGAHWVGLLISTRREPITRLPFDLWNTVALTSIRVADFGGQLRIEARYLPAPLSLAIGCVIMVALSDAPVLLAAFVALIITIASVVQRGYSKLFVTQVVSLLEAKLMVRAP